MRLAAFIVTLIVLSGAVVVPTASAAPLADLTFDRRDVLARHSSTPRSMARLDRLIALSSEPDETELAALDDPNSLLAEPAPPTAPLLKPPPGSLEELGGAKPRSAGAAVPGLLAAEQQPDVASGWLSAEPKAAAPGAIGTVLLLVVLVLLRRQIFRGINWGMARLVSLQHGSAAAPSRGKRRRRSSGSRRRAADVRWYFRSVHEPQRGSRRRRWTTSGRRQREYVVADVVYATAAAQPSSRYLLLANSAN